MQDATIRTNVLIQWLIYDTEVTVLCYFDSSNIEKFLAVTSKISV